MKKILCITTVIILCALVLCGCETREEKAAREAREEAQYLEEYYQNKLNEYNEFKNDMYTYKYYQNLF